MLLPLVLALFAQEQKFETNVNQVLTPVVVLDAKGRKVGNLKPADFEIFEDGVPQKIVSFTAGTEALQSAAKPARTAAPGAPDVSATASTRRTFVICVDTLHSAFDNFPRVRKALESVFEREEDADADYWLVSLGKKPVVLAGPTRDPKAVLTAIRSKQFLNTIEDSESSALGAQIAQIRRQMDDYCARCPCGNSRRRIPGECEGPKQSIVGLATTGADRTQIYTEFFLKELMAVVTDLSHMPGDRAMLLMSDGFNLVPGRELYGVMRAYFPNEERWQLNERDTTSHLEPILKLAAASNITVYGLNSTGLTSSSGVGGVFDASAPGPSARNQTASILTNLNREASRVTFENGTTMAALAKATGGIYLENSNALARGIERAFAETREYYVLGYVSTNTAMDGAWRAITVKVNMPNAAVRSRTGYWGHLQPSPK